MASGKKLYFEEIESFVENNSSCILLSNEYIPNKKLEFKCYCGNIFKTDWNSFKNGKTQCNECSKDSFKNKVSFSIEQVREYAESFDCKLLSNEYKKSTEPLRFVFSCGHEGKRSFASFKVLSKVCKMCSDVNRSNNFSKLTMYAEENGCSILTKESEYGNGQDKVLILFKCGHEGERTANKFLKGTSSFLCFNCRNKRTDSIESLVNYFKENDCILLSSEVKTVDDSLDIIFSCGHRGTRSLYNFENGSTTLCSKCSGSIRFEINDIIEFLEGSPFYYIEGEYLGLEQKITFGDIDGYKYHVSFSGVKTAIKRNISSPGYGLERFSTSNKFTDYNIDRWIEIEHKEFSIFSGTFTDSQNRNLELLCSKCGELWFSKWSNIKSGKGCPHCASSKGEDRVSKFLQLNVIDKIRQAVFEECYNKGYLYFDFYLPDYNMCIEYQGKQHYEPIEYFGGEKAFKEQKKRDRIKVKYCKDNGIPLLIIPYWDFDNIESILSEALGIA